APAGTMVTVCSARKAGRGCVGYIRPLRLDLATINAVSAVSCRPRAIGRTRNQKIPKTGHPRARPLDFAALLPASPRHIARESPDAALRPPLPRLRPRAHQLRAVRHPLVCSRLHRRHPAGVALCARDYPPRAVLGLPGAHDGHRLRRLRAVGDARHHLGGRIGYILFYNPSYFAAHPLESLQLWKGGMSFHGGFLGCVLAVVLFARHRGLSILSLGDITCAAGTIGIFLVRIANFINGELWGRPTDVPWAMVFPTGGPMPRHPSQLYEAALEGLLLFVVLTALIRAGALKRSGFILGAFSFGYAVARSIGEHFREPDPQLGFLWGGLTMGTLLSLPLMLAG